MAGRLPQASSRRFRGTRPRENTFQPGDIIGDPGATATVDALLTLWFALVKLNGGIRRVALRIVREG